MTRPWLDHFLRLIIVHEIKKEVSETMCDILEYFHDINKRQHRDKTIYKKVALTVNATFDVLGVH